MRVMAQLKRIVFGDDGSAAADVAWLWLNSHSWPGWVVTVVHAELPDLTRLPIDAGLTSLHEWQPRRPRQNFAEACFAEVRHLTALADPRIVLWSCQDAGLVVVGPHGPGLLKAVHLGSTAEWLLVRPPAPLLIVKSARPVRSVLACMDGSPSAWRAVRALAALPWLSTVSVTVLGAEDGRAEVLAAVPAAAAELRVVAGEVQERIAGGPATTAIHDVLDRMDVDLVVLGTRGHTGLKHLLLGSTASHVARAAQCSVLVAADCPRPSGSE
jgi:nucleotide-binding universal stress UspA family protein